jgi:hypothetical protein
MKYLLMILAVAYLLSGLIACKSNNIPEPQKSKAISYGIMSIKELHDALGKKDFLLINGHIPYAGEISRTDLFIPQ